MYASVNKFRNTSTYPSVVTRLLEDGHKVVETCSRHIVFIMLQCKVLLYIYVHFLVSLPYFLVSLPYSISSLHGRVLFQISVLINFNPLRNFIYNIFTNVPYNKTNYMH
jgi:hypothetical protein